MKKDVKNTLILIFLTCFFANSGHAFDIDETVDDEIRKNYNPNQLIQDTGINDTALDKKNQAVPIQTIDPNLPSLPNITKTSTSKSTKTTKTISATQKYDPYKGGHIKVKGGTSFNVTSNVNIADWQSKGTKVSFTLPKATHGRGFSVPAGTVFQGEIVESHQPQITCNGGLVAIKVDTMIYKNQKIPISAFITRANDKKIFLNNIKGERTYLKTMWKKGNWGRTLFNKMASVSVNFGKNGATLALSPITFAYGTLCLGLNTLTSPICAFFSKGGHVSIPANSNFRIKLLEDAMID
jgi:hypothetical protein